MSGEDPYRRRVEWESYAEPFTMAISDPIDGLPPGIESITLRRDEQYRLVAELVGKADAEAYGRYYQTLREEVPGTMLTDVVDGGDYPFRLVTVGHLLRLTLASAENPTRSRRRRRTDLVDAIGLAEEYPEAGSAVPMLSDRAPRPNPVAAVTRGMPASQYGLKSNAT